MQFKLAATTGLVALLAVCFAGQANASCCTYLNKCYEVAGTGVCLLPMTGSKCCPPPSTTRRLYDMETLAADLAAGLTP